ncbi:MAG: DNA cytosine methyltransferase [Terracidiphilus sp.]|jgi:DNA (cytosine-5)-methyltransferase 1
MADGVAKVCPKGKLFDTFTKLGPLFSFYSPLWFFWVEFRVDIEKVRGIMYPLFHSELRDNTRKAKGLASSLVNFRKQPEQGASSMDKTFYEFFAGGGMARAGLGREWTCLFANDFDHKKGVAYRANWGGGELKTADIRKLKTRDLPGVADLSWASFPCQDLSLAGAGAGLRGERSGTFWPFWKLMKGLIAENRAPSIIVLENVCGTLTAHGGKDFIAICTAVQQAGYFFGALVVDAALFVPQSRPRLFIICVNADLDVPARCIATSPVRLWHTRVAEPYCTLPQKVQTSWIWWDPPMPAKRRIVFSDVIEENPHDVPMYTGEQVDQLVSKMSDLNRTKLQKAQRLNRPIIGGLYRRTRIDENGEKVQRAEIRFDDLSGCLRTPAGGSSRQTVLMVHGNSIRARLISTRETARLMGLPESYILPQNYNEAYHLTGDGVVVPVVRHLAANIFEPVLQAMETRRTTAA